MAYLQGCNGCLGDFNWNDVIQQIGNTASQVISSVRRPAMPSLTYTPPPGSTYMPPTPIYSQASVMPGTYPQPSTMDWLPWLIGAGLVAGLVFGRKR